MKKYQKGLLSVIALGCILGSSVYATDNIELERKDVRTTYLQEKVTQSAARYDIRDAIVSYDFGIDYDGEDTSEGLEIYNQLHSGTCWAHAIKQVYETTLRRLNGISDKISVSHIAYSKSNSFDGEKPKFWLNRDALYAGAGTLDAFAYLTSGEGIVADSEMKKLSEYLMPYEEYKAIKDSGEKPKADNIPVETVEGKDSITIIKDWVILTEPVTTVSGMFNSWTPTEEKSYLDKMDTYINNIKNHIQDYGGVYIGFWWDDKDSDSYNESGFNRYYNSETYGFYSPKPRTNKLGGHGVTLIGWDDSYSINNFKEKPSRTGAWLAVNSWGKTWGNNGTFYISYDQIMQAAGITEMGYINDEIIYQYDGKTVNGAEDAGANEFFMGNVYTRENPDKPEFLKEVALTSAYEIDYEIYLNADGGEINGDILGNLIYTSKETMAPGYHTIELDNPIELTGEKFAVVVKYKRAPNKRFGKTYLEKTDGQASSVEKIENSSYYGNNINALDDIGKNGKWACIKALTTEITEEYSMSNKISVNKKNQEQSENCWTMPMALVIETNRTISQMQIDEISVRHMDYATSQSFLNKAYNRFGYNRKVNSAGTAEWALAYFTNGTGPIYEFSMPFKDEFPDIDIKEITNKTVIAKVKEWIQLPAIEKSITNGKTTYTDGKDKAYTNEQVKEIRNKIKLHLKLYGAIATEMYIDGSNIYYNDKTKSYYCDNDKAIVDHGVAIIGWDDNYSRENFNENHRPCTDGAYLVQNSWGDDAEVAERFYISYEDMNIEKKLYGIIKTEDKNNTETIYQYDELGRNTEFSIGTEETYGANVFTRNDKDKEVLNEISISTYMDMNYEVYVNPNNGNLNSEEMILVSKSDTPIGNGYHTIEFDTPIELTGKKFAVAVKYMGTDDNLVTMQAKTNGAYSGVSAYSGESFIGANLDEMVDLTDVEGLPEGNICIKAFTQKDGATYSVIVGDVNLDGHVTATDMSTLEMHLVGIKYLRGYAFYAADLNTDLMLTPVDLSILKKKVVGVR